MGWTVRDSGPDREIFFSLLNNVQTGSGVHPASYSMDIENPFLGVKRSGREADHSSPATAEGENDWRRYTSCPSICLRGMRRESYLSPFATASRVLKSTKK
jgi:hypothetical protein